MDGLRRRLSVVSTTCVFMVDSGKIHFFLGFFGYLTPPYQGGLATNFVPP